MALLRPFSVLVVGLSCLGAGCGGLTDDATDDPGAPRNAGSPSPAGADTPARAKLVALAVSQEGVPKILRSSRPLAAVGAPKSVQEAAHGHLAALADHYALGPEETAALRLKATRELPSGAHLLRFEQQYDELPVVDSRVSLLLDREYAFLGAFGTPRARARAPQPFSLNAQQTLAQVLSVWLKSKVLPESLQHTKTDTGGFQRFLRQAPAALGRDTLAPPELLRARAVYLPEGTTFVPAYELELRVNDAVEGQLAVHLIASGIDGEVLRERSLLHEAHSYRVWADTNGDQAPWSGPEETVMPHPTGRVDGFVPLPLPSRLLSVTGRNHGPLGEPDPWLPAGATTTAGNNVLAYANLDGLGGFDPETDVRPLLSERGAFEHRYALESGPLASDEQARAATVQLFYTTNWLHDWYYDSGFTEAFGNAQLDNLGRGGAEEDRLIAEAMTGARLGIRNSARLYTSADGSSPLMQIFLWEGPRATRLLVGTEHAFPAIPATFTDRDFLTTARLAPASDVEGEPSLACTGELSDLRGKIALVDRGGCTFVKKAQLAQEAGALGLVIANNREEAIFQLDGDAPEATLPTVGISSEQGSVLRTLLLEDSPRVTLASSRRPDRAASLDGSIVAHEWGHLLHSRLAGTSTPQTQAMGEGWGDFVALQLMLGAEDDPRRSYTLSGYGGRGASPDIYFGLRRLPYSTNRLINPLSFRHVSDAEPLPTDVPLAPSRSSNSEIHNAGEVWATMLFDAYAALVEAFDDEGRDFRAAQRAMSDYVVSGLMLHPADATFTEARDALIFATFAINPAHGELIARAFADRGAGSCAVSPPADSLNFVEVEESNDLAPRVIIEALEVRELPGDCRTDGDGWLDSGESGALRVHLKNIGFGTATSLSLSVEEATPSGHAHLPAQPQLVSVPLPSQQSTTVDIPFQLVEPISQAFALALRVTLEAEGSCQLEEPEQISVWTQVDRRAGLRADFETAGVDFFPDGEEAERVWARTTSQAPLDHSYLGANVRFASDTALVSPSLDVSTSEAFKVSFRHRYRFEFEAGQSWDGGVIELTTDDGETWQDVSFWGAAPHYTGSVATASRAALRDRPAYVGESPEYPAESETQLDFGHALAGQQVRIRFRIATDELGAAEGWQLDELELRGVANQPLSALVAEPLDTPGGSCDVAPDPRAPEENPDNEDEPAPPLGAAGETGETAPGHVEGAGGTNAQADLVPAGTTPTSDGCGCTTAGRPTWPLPGLGALLAALGVLRLRRRRSPAAAEK